MGKREKPSALRKMEKLWTDFFRAHFVREKQSTQGKQTKIKYAEKGKTVIGSVKRGGERQTTTDLDKKHPPGEQDKFNR
jgi:hypothetical protein